MIKSLLLGSLVTLATIVGGATEAQAGPRCIANGVPFSCSYSQDASGDFTITTHDNGGQSVFYSRHFMTADFPYGTEAVHIQDNDGVRTIRHFQSGVTVNLIF